MAVDFEISGRAAILRLNRPPVNAIAAELRQQLQVHLRAALADPQIERIILTGSEKIFAAGADAAEFDAAPIEPHLPDLVAEIEQSSKPVIAAIYGAALGGGLELALACRWRIAAPNARLGLPEVILGVVPGAGATQRLPRLIGIGPALQMVTSGKPLAPQKALSIGLIDAIEPDPLAAALAQELSPLLARPLLAQAPNPAADKQAGIEARQNAARKMRGQDAPQSAADLIEMTSDTSFADGIKAEREAFLSLRQSPQCRALRHIFFAERAARTPGWLKKATQPASLQQAAVIGGGTMGAAIAWALDQAGLAVCVVEMDDSAAERASSNLARLAAAGLKRGLLSQEAHDAALDRIRVQASFDGLANTDIVIEAVFEDMAVKKELFARLESAAPSAVLASNTSYLDIDEMAGALADPSRLLGLHFFSPAHIMKLLEVVRASQTSDSALRAGFDLAEKLRKIPVITGVCDGFIGNRINFRMRESADILLLSGSIPTEIDEAMRAFGYAMGPYETQDMSGLDISWATRKRKAATRDPSRPYVKIADRMCESGRLGRKTGTGWYRYDMGGQMEDPMVEDLILEESRLARVERRVIAEAEIQETLLLAMINEAAHILGEGMAASGADIDLVMVHGFGFPRWRGGLAWHADQMGLKTILASLEKLAADEPVLWEIAPLIRELAASGGSFASWAKTAS